MGTRSWTGEWWSPHAVDHKVAGTLTSDDNGELFLALIGAIQAPPGKVTTAGDVVEQELSISSMYPRILGRVGNDGFTLDDCFEVHRSGGFFSPADSQRLAVNTALQSVHLEEGEGLDFTQIHAYIEGLAYWTGKSGIRRQAHEATCTVPSTDLHTLTVQRIQTETCQAPDGALISLSQSLTFSGDGITRTSVEQDYFFTVKYDHLTDLDRMLEQVGDIRNLIAVGVDAPAAFSKVQLEHPQVQRSLGDDSWQEPITMHTAWQVRPAQTDIDYAAHQMFFTLPELGGLPVVERWLSHIVAHRPALNRLMATRYAHKMYPQDRFSNCAAALEAYDREQYSDDKWFVDRLLRTTVTAGHAFETLVGDTRRWAEMFRDCRNIVSHQDSGRPASASTYHFLAESGFWLFVLAALARCEAAPDLFERIEGHPEFQWLAHRIDEILAK